MANGQLEAMGYLTETWRDETLAWNDTEFRNISTLFLEDGAIWSPGMAQLNAVGEDIELATIALNSDGMATRVVARKYITFCQLDMRFYPADEHTCSFEFVSVYYPASQMKLVSNVDEVDLSYLGSHGEWTAKEAYVRQKFRQNLEYTAAGIECVYIMARQSGFTVLHKAVPLFILKFADIFIHIVPLNSGERISYAVTLLLAFVFWQAIVTEELPQNSSKISIFSIIMTVCMTVSGISTVTSVILCRIAHFDEDRPVPEFLKKLSRRCRWKKKRELKRIQRAKTEYLKKIHQANGHVKNGDVKEDFEFQEKLGQLCDERFQKPVTWVEAANSIDTIFVFCHAFVTLGTVIGFGLIFRH